MDLGRFFYFIKILTGYSKADDEFTFIERSALLYIKENYIREILNQVLLMMVKSFHKTFKVFCGFSDNNLPKNISDQLDNNKIYWSEIPENIKIHIWKYERLVCKNLKG